MNTETLRNKIMGCWLGKAAGGTLGQPYEGCDGPLSLDYYCPVPTDMIPNDDLDLQVLWACVLEKMDKPVIDRDVFAHAWLTHVNFPWDEYGLAIRNLRAGINAPQSGSFDNWFGDGLGAAIRSEIWACLAPCNPELAAKYAFEDACVDHDGDGIYAEQFLAALESAAFEESDIEKLIDVGLSVIPSDCRLAQAVKDAVKWSRESTDFLAIRRKILDKWGSENFTDAVMNLPLAVMALILGKGEFGTTICLSVNCGRDADCTTATVGAILGIINPEGIEEKWLKPIGRKLVLNDGIVGITHPETLDGFTDMLLELKEKVTLRDKPDGPEVDTSKMTLRAEGGVFGPWFAQDENKFSPVMPIETDKLVFSGTKGSIDAAKIPGDSLYLMRFRFKMKDAETVRVMFNTHANVRVWLDGKYAFGREAGGRMAPSFHRCPLNQYCDAELSAGEHEMLVGIGHLEGAKKIDWVMGVGIKKDFQWCPVEWL